MRQRSGGLWFKASLSKYFMRPNLENTQQKKRAGRVAQEVQHLPSKCEALSSNSSTTHTTSEMLY
jgi:hypothetical protein